jgi:hypothetical protein
VSFSRAGLSVGEDGAVVALESLVNHRLDFALFIEILLGRVRIKEIVEVKFSKSVRFFPDFDFMSIFVDFDEGVFEALLFLRG